MKSIAFILFVLTFNFTFSQDTTLLVSGPMLCHVSHREATIWLEPTILVHSVQIKYWKIEQAASAKTVSFEGKLQQDYNPIKITLGNLEMNTGYQYEIILNNKKQAFPFPLSLKTKNVWEYRTGPPPFSFIFGSCTYVNDPLYDRPGKSYGRDLRIFDSIAENSSDFMIWCGDNVYTREADYSSRTGFYYRYSHDRSIPPLKKLMASRSHYSIWDDHDYGPNDAGYSFNLKEISLSTFKDFTGNPSYGEHDNPGTYTQFTWNDCDFFLMDDRYYRSDERIDSASSSKHFFGDKQLEWLENSLLDSRASFKFIVVGNQVLNPLNEHECFRHYKQEFDELMQFIVKYKIPGVIFLSGDRHYSDIIRWQPQGGYPLYDITSSAFTSGSYPSIAQTPEGSNPYRAVSGMVFDQNYIEITISGDKLNERVANITCYTVDGRIPWTYQIRQQELR